MLSKILGMFKKNVLEEVKINEVSEYLEKNPMKIFSLESGVDCCPVCEGELLFEKRSAYDQMAGSFKEYLTQCKNGCFLRVDNDELKSCVDLYLFNYKYRGIWKDNLEYYFKDNNFKAANHPYFLRQLATFEKFISRVKEYRENEKFTLEWLSNNRVKIDD